MSELNITQENELPSFLEKGLKNGKYAITELGIEQRCSKCGDYYPLDREFFHANTTAKTGFQHHCKACYKTNFDATNKIRSSWERLFN